jgi:hypothetical protein
MKKIILGISLFSLVLLTLISGNAFAGDDRFHSERGRHGDRHNNSNFNADNELRKSKCVVATTGDPIIDVKQKVQNDVDSGFASYWAFDYYTRSIKVWPTGTDTYCAVITYDGRFYAVPGQVGPGDTPSGALINTSTNAPVNGDMFGGRRATITGTFLGSGSSWPTSGNVGTTNYQCDLSQNCPGYDAEFGAGGSWANKYFQPGVTNTDQWWGWQYKGGSHGTWVNECANNASDTVPGNNPACLGSSGNIL